MPSVEKVGTAYVCANLHTFVHVCCVCVLQVVAVYDEDGQEFAAKVFEEDSDDEEVIMQSTRALCL
jgi:hypothetical protein